MCRSNYHFSLPSLLNTIICHLPPFPFSQSTASFRESRTSLPQTLPPFKKDIDYSEEEYEEEEEEYEEEEEEEEEKEIKTGKVQNSVWWFLEDVDET